MVVPSPAPVPPGTFQLHGEYYTVAWALGMLILVFAAVEGFLLGLLRNRPGRQRVSGGEAQIGS